MIAISENVRPETEARERRVAALFDALRPALPPAYKAVDAMDLCGAFDQAVEFAACEGKPVSSAMAEFFQEQWGPGQAVLQELVAPVAPGIPSKLPVLPRAAAQLLRTSDETTSVAELESIAATDPTLAAQLLSTANSALYGSRSEICRLREALLRVGIPVARKVLLAASFSAIFATKHQRELWSHSQAVALASHEIALRCGADADAAYVAGLVHDIGRVAFTVFPAVAVAAEQKWRAAGFPLIYAETLAYGSDHAAFGARLLRSWHVPAEIAEAVAHHHRPECSESRLHAVVHLAEDAGEDLWSNMRKRTAMDRAGIGIQELEGILAAVLPPAPCNSGYLLP